MTDLERILEELAARGTPRGAPAVLAEAQRTAGARLAVRRHRRLGAGVVLAAVLAGSIAVVVRDATRDVVTTTGGDTPTVPTTIHAPGTVRCDFRYQAVVASAFIDATVVPSSVETQLDRDHRVTVSVLADTDGQSVLRVDVFAPDDPATHNPSLPAGVIGRFQSRASPGGPIGLGGGLAGVNVACADEYAQWLDRTFNKGHREPITLDEGRLVLDPAPAGYEVKSTDSFTPAAGQSVFAVAFGDGTGGSFAVAIHRGVDASILERAPYRRGAVVSLRGRALYQADAVISREVAWAQTGGVVVSVTSPVFSYDQLAVIANAVTVTG